ncbi:hypothetical protein LX32DRAFT_231072 [Colletotrichum zoysiae]|uniref:Uncharacterized protein n=1 Tax=Colletotrichum zoysiae TaxID=1216348 RepID=A0AAD9H3L1_9PEZI|nr:hypothetical protein LX32DRAFT_231072 [Colletotrichum zoysiae]
MRIMHIDNPPRFFVFFHFLPSFTIIPRMGAAPKSRRRDPTPVRQRPKRPGSPYVAGQVQALRLCCGGLLSHLGSGPETCYAKFPPAAGSRMSRYGRASVVSGGIRRRMGAGARGDGKGRGKPICLPGINDELAT